MSLIAPKIPELAAPVVRTGRHAGSRRRHALAGAAAVLVSTGLVTIHALLYGRWIVDDAAITFAYARSMATGAGPVLQPGAATVEGYSNPSWLAILTLGRWTGLFDHGAWFGVPDYVMFPKTVALLCCAGMFTGFHVAARAISRHPAFMTVTAGAITAAVPSFVIWCVSGLENSLLALAAVWIGAVLVRAAVAGRLLRSETAMACGLLAALAALTRPDGLIYATAYPLAALVLLKSGQLPRAVAAAGVAVVAFVVPFGAYLAWRMATFGEVLPNTALAKSQELPGLAELSRPTELAAYAGWPAVLLVGAVVGGALSIRGRHRDGLLALLVPLALAVVAFAVLAPDWMGQYRFATPVWPLSALAGVLAASVVLPRLAARGQLVVGVITLVAMLVATGGWAAQLAAFRSAPTAPLCLVVQDTGRAINGYARVLGIRDATVAAPDIGGAALTSHLQIVDLAGLADAQIAGYWKTGNMAGLRDHVFDDVRPAFLKIHGGWSMTTGIPADPRFAAHYVPISTTGPTNGDWVRRDLVADPAELAAVRAYAAQVAGPEDARYRAAPRSSCGDHLS